MVRSLDLYVTPVKGSVDASSNTSRVRIELYIVTDGGSYSHDYTTRGSISMDGAQIADLDGKWVDMNTTTNLYTGEHTVQHGSDGKKTVTVAASFSLMTQASPGFEEASATVELPNIAQAQIKKLDLRVTPVKNSANAAKNTSRIRIELDVETSGGYYSHTGTTGAITADGTKIVDLDGKWVNEGTVTNLYAGEKEIAHGEDGSKTVTVAASFSLNTAFAPGTETASTAVELPTIGRATAFDALVCSSPYFTGTYSISYTPQSSELYNHCRIDLVQGSAVTLVRAIRMGKKSAKKQTGTVVLTAQELGNIYALLPDSVEGQLRFRIGTYADSDYLEQVGSAAFQTLTQRIEETAATKPGIEAAAEAVNAGMPAAFDGIYVQTRSKVLGSITGTGKYGAEIASARMEVQGNGYAAPSLTSGYLTMSGQTEVICTVTDSRGFTAEQRIVIDVVPYAPPRIVPYSAEEADLVCARCDSAGNLTQEGTYLKIKARREYSRVVSGGEQKNKSVIRYRWKQEGGAYTQWSNLVGRDAAFDTCNPGPLLDGQLLTTRTYTVQVGVLDDLGGEAVTTRVLTSEAVFMHKKAGGNALGLGKRVEEGTDHMLDVAWDLRLRGELRMGPEGAAVADFVTEQGTAAALVSDASIGTLHYRKWASGKYEAWGKLSPVIEAGNVTNTGGCYATGWFEVQLPFDAVSGAVTASCESIAWVVCTGFDTPTAARHKVRFRICRLVTFTGTYNVSLHVAGELG